MNFSIPRSLTDVKAYSPIVRVQQRRYKTPSLVQFVDGKVEFDLRTILGDGNPHFGRPIKQQQQWAQGAYELLKNKKSNIQFQNDVMFFYSMRNELNSKRADRHFVAVFTALRRFAGIVID